MGRLIKLVIALGLLWSAYWFLSGYLLRQQVSAWFAAQEARGWQAEFSAINTTGYPLRHQTLLVNPVLADPGTGLAWRAGWLLFDSPAIWPGDQVVQFPDTPQRLSYFDQSVTLAAEGMFAELQLHPGTAMEVQRLALRSGRWSVSDAGGLLLGAEDLVLAMDQTDQPMIYDIEIGAATFTPGDRLRSGDRQASALPPSFQTLTLAMTVGFDRSWDRRAIEERRPQPRLIDLALAEAHWGPMHLKAVGKVTVDSQGVPTGTITLRAENWRDMLSAAEASGTLPPVALAPIETALNLLSKVSGNPNSLDVKLTFAGGSTALGPLPLGPAPRLILR